MDIEKVKAAFKEFVEAGEAFCEKGEEWKEHHETLFENSEELSKDTEFTDLANRLQVIKEKSGL